MKKLFRILGLASIFFFVTCIPFSVAYFLRFDIGPGTIDLLSISSLKNAESSITVSIDPDYTNAGNLEGGAPYKISTHAACDIFDEEQGTCLSAPPDLCPYLSLTPANGEEQTETGFPVNPSAEFEHEAAGSLDVLNDTTDNWTLSATSPCFAGECPSNYDSTKNGTPLPQNLKGQTFKCELHVRSAELPFLIGKVMPKPVLAAGTDKIMVSAVLSGGNLPVETGTSTTTPVIIVPGIMGSYLNDKNNSEIWPNLARMILPGNDSYLDDLAPSESGESLNIFNPAAIIQELEGYVLFTRLFDQLALNGFSENLSLFEFPYDWRLDVGDEVLLLKQKIDGVKLLTGVSRVDLIAHSMGGLLVKAYLNKYGGNSVRNFVDIGTPHVGSPKAFKILNFGDDMGFKPLGVSILNSAEVKKISQNMPSAYELLPSQKYLDDSDNNYKYYVFNGVETNKRLTFDDTKQYLKDAGRNSALVDKADAFHQEIDGLNPADYGIKTYNIVGCGTPTLGQFYILGQKNGETEYDIKMIDGDGTVPIKSAEAISANATYFVKNGVHATLPSTPGVKELVAALLTSTTTPNISSYPNLSASEAECPAVNGTLVSFHSPITLDAYDQAGNHAGLDANGDTENNIPGADYEVIENNKFVFLPLGRDYTIKGKATDAGTFDVRIENVVNGEVARTTIWNNLPLTPMTATQFVVGSTTSIQIALDSNGDGIFESSKDASSVSSGLVESIAEASHVTAIFTPTPATPISIGRSHLTQKVSTTTPSQPTVVIAAPKLVAIKPAPVAKVMKKSVPAPSPLITRDQSLNTGAVYKSTNSSIKNLFKNAWAWFKRKL